MKCYIVYDRPSEKILRTGVCADRDFSKQAKAGESIKEGKANDATQKVVDDKVVDKTSEEIKADNPIRVIPESQRQAHITNEQWQNVLSKLSELEKQ